MFIALLRSMLCMSLFALTYLLLTAKHVYHRMSTTAMCVLSSTEAPAQSSSLGLCMFA